MPFIGNQPALSYTSFAKQDFTTSATTSYTLDQPVTNENEIALFINFVRQEPSTAYSASGTSLTLTSATSASDDMYCVFLGKAVQTVNPPSGSVGASQIADSSIALGKLSATGTKDSTTFLRGDNSFQEVPAGGITQADVLYYNGTNSFSSGQQNTLSSWTRQTHTGFAKIGDGVTQSSGIFTLPATGIYLVQLHLYVSVGLDLTYLITRVYGTQNNGTNWTNIAETTVSKKQVVGNTYFFVDAMAQFDCTNTSTDKIYINTYGTHNYSIGSDQNATYISFIRLGDT